MTIFHASNTDLTLTPSITGDCTLDFEERIKGHNGRQDYNRAFTNEDTLYVHKKKQLVSTASKTRLMLARLQSKGFYFHTNSTE